jgi:D-xylose transport system permease protein
MPVIPASAEAPPAETPDLRSRFALNRRLEALPLIVALILVVIIFQAINGLFLNPRNLVNLLTELAPLAFIAIASTVMILMGEIDLSLGSLAGFSVAILATFLAMEGMPWPVAIGLTFLIGIGISGLQGVIVVAGRVRSFAVTLAGFLVWYGAQLMVLGPSGYIALRRPPLNQLSLARVPEWISLSVVGIGGAIVIALWLRSLYKSGRVAGTGLAVRGILGAVGVAALLWFVTYLQQGGGVPLIFVFVLLITTGVWVVLTRTALGRHLYAVGGDLHAARESGININKVKWIGFAASGALATCAGISILSYTGGADSSAGTGALLLAGIGATVVGGVSLTGGRGSLWGAFGGAILLEAVGNGLNLMSLSFYAVYIVEGLVVLAALLTDAALRRRLSTR